MWTQSVTQGRRAKRERRWGKSTETGGRNETRGYLIRSRRRLIEPRITGACRYLLCIPARASRESEVMGGGRRRRRSQGEERRLLLLLPAPQQHQRLHFLKLSFLPPSLFLLGKFLGNAFCQVSSVASQFSTLCEVTQVPLAQRYVNCKLNQALPDMKRTPAYTQEFTCA